MKERLEFLGAYRSGKWTMTELCRQFGISRQTGYVLLARVDAQGVDGLKPQSRAAHYHPNATPAEVVAAVLRARHRHPTWGPRKLFPGDDEPLAIASHWPAPSTIGDILSAAGLVQHRRRARQAPPSASPLGSVRAPNDVLCCDFKGWFRTGDGQRCDPLTITDAYSRMVLRCQLVAPTEAAVRPVFEACFREYGLPRAMRSDNGPPFASVSAGGLSRLSVWWLKLGILPERIQPGHPEQNGRHERFHRTLKAETLSPPAATPREQQRRFQRFVREFNDERPHEALGQEPPAWHYRPSPRSYPRPLLAELPLPDEAQRRRVRSNGEIKWQGHTIFIAEPLVGEIVGLLEGPTGVDAYFGPIFLGTLDPAAERLVRPLRRRRRGVATEASAATPRPVVGP